MNLSLSRRRLWPAALLAGALILTSGLAAITSGAEGKGEQAAAENPAAEQPAEPTPTPEPTPEPTPFPEFDPGTVTVRTSLFSEGFDEPVYITDDGANGKCLYVVERGGAVKIVGLGGAPRRKPFIDISSRVLTDNPRQGLHSIAFHPGFEDNGRFFLHYNDRKGAAVIAEFKGEPCKSRGKVGNKVGKKLFTVAQGWPNNNAGWIGFGAHDGKLYIPLGDGGGPWPGDPDGVGQTPKAQLSKVLRVDVDQPDLIARDNPYVRQAKDDKFRSRDGFYVHTWAWGLQDPRRSSFDRETGDFWIGDVGGIGHEEVNLVRRDSVTRKSGAPNFGWSHVEGEDTCHPANAPNCDPDDYVSPVHTYDKTPPQEGITGGYVYRGEAIPALQGVYLFSDFRSGFIWGLDAEAIYEGFEVPAHLLLDAPQGFVSFGEDDAGELYLVSLDGSIYQLGAEQR